MKDLKDCTSTIDIVQNFNSVFHRFLNHALRKNIHFVSITKWDTFTLKYIDREEVQCFQHPPFMNKHWLLPLPFTRLSYHVLSLEPTSIGVPVNKWRRDKRIICLVRQSDIFQLWNRSTTKSLLLLNMSLLLPILVLMRSPFLIAPILTSSLLLLASLLTRSLFLVVPMFWIFWEVILGLFPR